MKMFYFYNLKRKRPIPCSMREAKVGKRVTLKKIRMGKTLVRISTVFLGLDQNFLTSGPPILFETMVFGGPYNGLTRRYPTWSRSVRGHRKIVKLLKRPIDKALALA
jgi:hypothetical protein